MITFNDTETEMQDGPPRVTWKDWWAPAAIVITLMGAVLTVGGYINEVQEHERRIAALEDRDKQLSIIDVRTARIEAKLEVLTPDKGQKP